MQKDDHETDTQAERRSAQQVVQQTLSQLRRQIHRHIWLVTAASIAIWLGVTFWIVVGLDYLPVSLGLTDLPRAPRIVLLICIAIGLAALVYQQLLRRIFVPLDDSSLALLLERRFPNLDDALATTVAYQNRNETEADPFNDELVATSAKIAIEQVQHLPTAEVLNKRPLHWMSGGLATIVFTLIFFVVLAPESFLLAFQRSYLLTERTWPRTTKLTDAGLAIKPGYEFPELDESLYRPKFREGKVVVGAGSTFDVWVRAAAANDEHPDLRLPSDCDLYFDSANGERGWLAMRAEGGVIRGEQAYRYSGNPFEAILDEVELQFRGGDDRLTQYKIEVVPSPTLVSAELRCRFPDYMVDLESGSWTARAVKLPTTSPLPFGTSATFHAVANKPLAKVFVHFPERQETLTLDFSEPGMSKKEFELPLDRLLESNSMEIALLDVEGVLSEAKFSFQLPVVTDTPPRVRAELIGIGTAITPQAVIPIQGTIEDDYGVASAWVEIGGSEFDMVIQDLPLNAGNEFTHRVDFLELARDPESGLRLTPGPSATVSLTTKGIDRYNLDRQGAPESLGQLAPSADEEPNQSLVSAGQQGRDQSLELQVVTATELLRILERIEVGQRQRLEQIKNEMEQAQLQTIKTRFDVATLEVDPANNTTDEQDESNNADDEPISDIELKLVFARRALLQSNKSRAELQGVAESFADIRAQLINNRIESAERQERIEVEIVEPLLKLTGSNFPALETKLKELESKLLMQRPRSMSSSSEDANDVDNTISATDALEFNLLADEAIDDLQVILNELDQVMDKLIKYESYSELLDLFRDLIQEQEALIEETDNLRKKQGLSELFDGN